MRSIILVAGLVLACTIPNPAFDVDPSIGAPTVTGADSSGATTSTPPTSDTGDASAASTTTVDPGSSSTSDATSAVSTAISMGTDDTTGDTGEPTGCWAQGAGGWPLDGAPLNAFMDLKPADPFISPDGLSLYYVANDPRRVYQSTRVMPGDPFPNGVQLVIWGNDPAIIPGYPNVVLGGKELLISSKYDVYSAKAADDQPFDKFALPLPLTPPSTAKEETVITATADSATLIVNRRDGPPIGEVLPSSFRFYQYTRAQAVPGAAYAGGQDVTPMVAPLGLALCPTLSPDGLHLFFGSTTSETLTEASVNDVIGIFYTSRADRQAPWAVPEPLAITHEGKGITCPSSVTADGCQLAFHRFFYNQDNYSMHLAFRSP